MIPLFLDPAKARIALVGEGEKCERRLAWLRRLGGAPTVFSAAPSEALRKAAGAALVERWPDGDDLRGLAALWVADAPENVAREASEAARRCNVLVNVEDVKPLSDFHNPGIVKRGRLVLAAGTGGASPAAASLVRARLEAVFPEEWADALDELAEARDRAREAGESLDALTADARAILSRRALI